VKPARSAAKNPSRLKFWLVVASPNRPKGNWVETCASPPTPPVATKLAAKPSPSPAVEAVKASPIPVPSRI
jgi:hypothetical protein